MYINKKKIYGYYDQERYNEDGSWWGRILSGGNQHFKDLEEVKRDLEAIDTLIDSDFNNLSDKDYYYLISRFYEVDLTINDFLNIISRVNGVCYDKIELLNTRQTYEIVRKTGRGKDLDYYNEKYQVRWFVATTTNFNLNPNYNYSIDEIDKMLSNKKVVAISRCGEYIGSDKAKLLDEEPLKEIKTSKIECDSVYVTRQLYRYKLGLLFDTQSFNKLAFNSLQPGESDFSQKIYKEACSMIRIRLNKDQVLNDCKKILIFLKNEFDALITCIQESYFSVYSDKEKYLKLAEELMEINSRLLMKMENEENQQSSHKVLKRNVYH